MNGAVHLADTLTHADQSQAAVVHGMTRVEAPAFVGDTEANLLGSVGKTDIYGCTAIVTDGILHPFLNHAVKAERDIDSHLLVVSPVKIMTLRGWKPFFSIEDSLKDLYSEIMIRLRAKRSP